MIDVQLSSEKTKSQTRQSVVKLCDQSLMYNLQKLIDNHNAYILLEILIYIESYYNISIVLITFGEGFTLSSPLLVNKMRIIINENV